MRRSLALAQSHVASFLRASPNSLTSLSKSPFRVDRIKFHHFSYFQMCSSMVTLLSSKIILLMFERTAPRSVTVFPLNLADSSLKALFAFSHNPIMLTTSGSQLRFIDNIAKSLSRRHYLNFLTSALPDKLPVGLVASPITISQIDSSSWS